MIPPEHCRLSLRLCIFEFNFRRTGKREGRKIAQETYRTNGSNTTKVSEEHAAACDGPQSNDTKEASHSRSEQASIITVVNLGASPLNLRKDWENVTTTLTNEALQALHSLQTPGGRLRPTRKAR